MNILKKIIGVFILITASIFSLLLIFSIIMRMLNVIDPRVKFSAYDLGREIGICIGMAIILLILFYLLKFSLKLVGIKKIKIDPIDEIGN